MRVFFTSICLALYLGVCPASAQSGPAMLTPAPGVGALWVKVDPAKGVQSSFGIIQTLGEKVRLVQRTEMRTPCAFTRADDVDAPRGEVLLLPDPRASSRQDFDKLVAAKYAAASILDGGASPTQEQTLCALSLGSWISVQVEVDKKWGLEYRAPSPPVEGAFAVVAVRSVDGVTPSLGRISFKGGRTFLVQRMQVQAKCAAPAAPDLDVTGQTIIMLNDPKGKRGPVYSSPITAAYVVQAASMGGQLDQEKALCIDGIVQGVAAQGDAFAKMGLFAP